MHNRNSLKNLNDINIKENLTHNKKLESMKEIIHKVVSKVASDNWRKHIPVYGWTKMNYPSTIQPSLLEKYKEKEKIKNLEKESTNVVIEPGLLPINNKKSRINTGIY